MTQVDLFMPPVAKASPIRNKRGRPENQKDTIQQTLLEVVIPKIPEGLDFYEIFRASHNIAERLRLDLTKNRSAAGEWFQQTMKYALEHYGGVDPAHIRNNFMKKKRVVTLPSGKQKEITTGPDCDIILLIPKQPIVVHLKKSLRERWKQPAFDGIQVIHEWQHHPEYRIRPIQFCLIYQEHIGEEFDLEETRDELAIREEQAITAQLKFRCVQDPMAMHEFLDLIKQSQ